jgi:predicted membrane protein
MVEPDPPKRLRDRPTADLVVMWLAGIVGVLVIGSLLAVVLARLYSDHVDLDKAAARIADVTNTLIGAIVGYLAGRGVETSPPKEPPHADD